MLCGLYLELVERPLSPACLLAVAGISGTIGRHQEDYKMTIRSVIEVVIVVIVIYFAVRFFMKRG